MNNKKINKKIKEKRKTAKCCYFWDNQTIVTKRNRPEMIIFHSISNFKTHM
jgi:hypothetical protein